MRRVAARLSALSSGVIRRSLLSMCSSTTGQPHEPVPGGGARLGGDERRVGVVVSDLSRCVGDVKLARTQRTLRYPGDLDGTIVLRCGPERLGGELWTGCSRYSRKDLNPLASFNGCPRLSIPSVLGSTSTTSPVASWNRSTQSATPARFSWYAVTSSVSRSSATAL